jgi:hypothetical protein
VDLEKINSKPSGNNSPFYIPIKAFVIHGMKLKYQHEQKVGIS